MAEFVAAAILIIAIIAFFNGKGGGEATHISNEPGFTGSTIR